MKTFKTYLSDPDWNNSFIGKYLWIYRGAGKVNIEDEAIKVSSGPLVTEIERCQVRSIGCGSFSRWAKPIRLYYIEITWEVDSMIKHIYLAPKNNGKSGWFTSVWRVNKLVKSWRDELDSWSRNLDT